MPQAAWQETVQPSICAQRTSYKVQREVPRGKGLRVVSMLDADCVLVVRKLCSTYLLLRINSDSRFACQA